MYIVDSSLRSYHAVIMRFYRPPQQDRAEASVAVARASQSLRDVCNLFFLRH